QARPVVAIWRSRTNSPERGRAPFTNEAAVELHLVESGAHVVIFHVTVNTANRVGLAPGHPDVALALGKIVNPSLQPCGLFVVSHPKLKKTPIAVVAASVISGFWIIGVQMPIRYVACRAGDLPEELLAASDVPCVSAAGWGRVVQKVPFDDV